MLPIFLSGCRTLLILAGPTYCSRLWCVLECFVFLKMGGTRDELTFLQVGEADARSQLGGFDASKAQCFLKRDREKLLAVIEASFGDFIPFNKIVRSIFAAQLTADRPPTAVTTSSTTSAAPVMVTVEMAH